MHGVLYIAHGTRSKQETADAKALFEAVKNKVPEPIQEIGFLELSEPSIEEGFKSCVKKGATSIVVVPLFLLTAGHMKQDIPKILAALKKKYPGVSVFLRDAFGYQAGILDGIAELVKESATEIHPNDPVLLVARGSSDPDIHTACTEIAAGLAERLGVRHLSVCYLAAARPTFNESLQWTVRKTETGRKIIVIPYLLFPGVLFSGIKEKIAFYQKAGFSIVHTGPLSRHDAIQEIVIQNAAGKVDSDYAAVFD